MMEAKSDAVRVDETMGIEPYVNETKAEKYYEIAPNIFYTHPLDHTSRFTPPPFAGKRKGRRK